MLIMLFYLFDDIFDIINPKIKLSENKKMIKFMGDRTQDAANYGELEIDSMQPTIYEWKFKLHKYSQRINIGISSWTTAIAGSWLCSQHGCYYGIHSKKRDERDYLERSWSLYGSFYWKTMQDATNRLGSGDSTLIHLDLSKKEVQFVVNGDQTVMFNDIKTGNDVKYRLVVTIANYQDCVEITEFNQSRDIRPN